MQNRHVALKVIKAGIDTAQVVARFEAERQALMDHPAIATVFDGGSTLGRRPYFAKEYVPGMPASALYFRYLMLGGDPFIVDHSEPPEPLPGFAATGPLPISCSAWQH